MFDGETWTTYTARNFGFSFRFIRRIAIDTMGRAWLGTDNGLILFDGETWIAYTTENSGLLDDSIMSMAIDPSGRVWIGTFYGGVSVFDGEDWNTYTTKNSGLYDNFISCMAIDSMGRVWIGTERGGISVFDGEVWKSYTTENSGLIGNSINDIVFDSMGRVWVNYRYRPFITEGPPNLELIVSARYLTFRTYFFSPVSIVYTFAAFIILWLSLYFRVKPGLIGFIGWFVVVIISSPRWFWTYWLGGVGMLIVGIPFFGAIGALIPGIFSQSSERRKKQIGWGVGIGLVLGTIVTIPACIIFLLAIAPHI